ncbi:MAG: aspartate aminotransferase family protein [bacterium]|nr:aspartate aminotransferase family protein [bacterium]
MPPRFERKPRTAREEELLELARQTLPAGVRTPSFSPEYAMVVESASGCRIRDCSGNEYIDYLMGSGPHLLGHAPPAVIEAVQRQLAKGSSYLLVSEPAIELAAAIVRTVPCADRVCFNNSGSESTFFAMRIARAFRKRDKILKFEGGFHGMHDYAMMSNQWTRDARRLPRPSPNSAGIPSAIEEEVLIAPFNDLEATAAIIEEHVDELAGVIVEPLQRTLPPRPGFLEGLREITRQHGVVLIYDEVVTGFRLALGGAQEYYGVVPDLAAMCKGVASGYPISILCGREDIMDHANPMRQIQGDHVAQTGTFSGNPIACSAALATLGELEKPGTYEQLFARGRRLMDGLQEILDAAGIRARVSGEPPAFQPWFGVDEVFDFRSTQGADAALGNRFTELLLDRGIVKAHEKFFISTAHGDREIDETLEAFAEVAAEIAG